MPSAPEPSEATATAALVDFVARLDLADMPSTALHECRRSLLDSVGCIVGGSQHPATLQTADILLPYAGPPHAALLGQGRSTDPLTAALVNGLAGASYSYFDSYSGAHLHSGVVHAAALLAIAGTSGATGREMLTAFAAGMEAGCRITRALAEPPAVADMGWSMGGIVSGISAALACGKLLRLDREALTWAVGIAASGAAGTRAEHGTMTAALIFGQAAQAGVRAALLAAGGTTSSSHSLEGEFGYLRLFSQRPHAPALSEGLGEEYALLGTTYKPFPTDIAIHPAIDAALKLVAREAFLAQDVERIEVRAADLATSFCDRPDPVDELQAKFSVQHWVAAVVAQGAAGLAQGSREAVHDTDIAGLRARTQLLRDPDMPWIGAAVLVRLLDGRVVEERVDACVGSADRPLTDEQLRLKMLEQSGLVLGGPRAEALADLCWSLDLLPSAEAVAASAT